MQHSASGRADREWENDRRDDGGRAVPESGGDPHVRAAGARERGTILMMTGDRSGLLSRGEFIQASAAAGAAGSDLAAAGGRC
jgi:hypothetical protein